MKRKRLLWFLPILAVVIALVLLFMPRTNENQKSFLNKAELLKTEVVTDATLKALGDAPVESLGNVVFFSICDGSTRAKVYSGSGETLSDAWEAAIKCTQKAIKKDSADLRWVRVDVVSKAWPVTDNSLLSELDETPSGFDFKGLAFDPGFEISLLEGEMNGRGIYDYKENSISMSRLNGWLEETGREPMQNLPDSMTEFDCLSWLCDEDNTVYPLCNTGADTGRRQISELDAKYAKNIIDTASSFLVNQVKEDGSFVYEIKPQFDEEVDTYNIVRHSGTIWSLICRYRMFPDKSLKETIENTIDYMLSQVRYDEDGAAYLYEAKDYEIKLGGNGIAVVALTEYMDVFQSDIYRDVCIALGEGILKQQDPETGSYWHILINGFERGEEFRTVYYDGECTFALSRLYSLTGEQKWLDADCEASARLI